VDKETKKLFNSLTTEQKFEFLLDIIEKYAYLGQGDLIDRLKEYINNHRESWISIS